MGQQPSLDEVYRRLGDGDGQAAGSVILTATRLNPDGTQVICLSNHAEIPADRLASAALASLTRDQRADPASILAAAAPGISNSASDEDHPAPGTRYQAVGTYRSDEVPGTLRLTRGGGRLYLWRRGTAQRLVPLSPQTHKGEGCTLDD